MKNRDIYQRDPSKITLLNNGVATMTDALAEGERRTLRFELENFVCEGEYQRNLVRVLDSYLSNQGQPEQRAAWVSGFFGSGKSHLAKMLRFLWTDYTFPEDDASARGLARLPNDVQELLKEISTLGKRGHGLHAAAGTLGAGAGDSVQLALLGIAFKSAELPESLPQAKFCLWLKKNDIYDQVCAAVEAEGRDFRRELNDMYVSPLIAKALLGADPNFAMNEKEAKAALRAQFPKPKDITGSQGIDHLVHECGYEHWHGMLFARFLAENHLLIEPEMGVAITLEKCEELAKEEGSDKWALAARFAHRMLPQVFLPDHPVFEVRFAREYRLKLESLVEDLAADVFTATDSLGWVYQFWQSKKKDEVNRSEVKIGRTSCPP